MMLAGQGTDVNDGWGKLKEREFHHGTGVAEPSASGPRQTNAIRKLWTTKYTKYTKDKPQNKGLRVTSCPSWFSVFRGPTFQTEPRPEI